MSNVENGQPPQPLVAIDVVPLRFNGKQFEVAISKRKFDPYIGELALPGVLLGHETITEAAYRALESKTGIAAADVLALVQIGAFDTTDRDPRGPTLSIAHYAIISPKVDNDTAIWYPVDAHPSLPFDHARIITAAVNELGLHLWRDIATTRAVLGRDFPTSAAVRVTELLSDEPVDKTNFTRTLKGHAFLEQAGTVNTGRGRPSRGWRFV